MYVSFAKASLVECLWCKIFIMNLRRIYNAIEWKIILYGGAFMDVSHRMKMHRYFKYLYFSYPNE